MKPRVGRLLNDARFSFAPTGGEDVLRQGLLMLAMYAAYDVSRALVVGREDTAMANGLFFLNLEKAMHIYVEPWVQSHISSIPGAMGFMVWAYGALHLPLIMGAMVWVFTQRRSEWKLIRNWFLGINFMAVLLYFLLPTAPPRMIFTAGIVDMSYMYGKRPAILENGFLANPFAAMPSLHFAYALFIALRRLHARAAALAALGRLPVPGARAGGHRRHGQPLHRGRPRQRAGGRGGVGPGPEPAAGRRARRRDRAGPRARRLTWRTSRPATPTPGGAASSRSASCWRAPASRPTCSRTSACCCTSGPSRSSSPATSCGRPSVMIVAAVCDALDGAVARAGVGPTKAGAFLDSTTDRISELLVAGALAVYWAGHGHWWTTFATLLFMGASQLVSYTRARAEALGVECKVGLMSRPERIVVLMVGLRLLGLVTWAARACSCTCSGSSPCSRRSPWSSACST